MLEPDLQARKKRLDVGWSRTCPRCKNKMHVVLGPGQEARIERRLCRTSPGGRCRSQVMHTLAQGRWTRFTCKTESRRAHELVNLPRPVSYMGEEKRTLREDDQLDTNEEISPALS